MDQVAQVREKVNIVELISSFVPLKRAGRNFKATCPFHTEKTPSFVVSPERQIWHCFGCSKGGDCFTFLMEYENMDFVEALRTLAKEAGVELKQYHADASLSSKKEKMYVLNKLACDFYHYILTEHNAGKRALFYLLEERKLTVPLINTFKLGFSPGIGNALSNYLTSKKGYTKEDLSEAGLSVQRGGRDMSDFFVGRITFPLHDHRGNVVGFSGRVIDGGERQQSPKYINTRDTLVYQKGSNFFGIHIAKEEMKKIGRVILFEGEFDVITAFAHGIKNALAVKGTALTEPQVNTLTRYVRKVSLCFDQDSAGQEAMKRALPLLEQKGLTVTVVVPPHGKDADESLREHPLSFKRALESAISVYDFLFERALSLNDVRTAEGKRHIGEALLPLFYNISNQIVREHYIRKLSFQLETSYESIMREVEKIAKRGTLRIATPLPASGKRQRSEVLEEYLLALIIQSENPREVMGELVKGGFDAVFTAPAYQKIRDRLGEWFSKNESFDARGFSRFLQKELVDAFDTCFLLPMPQFEHFKHRMEEVVKVAKELQLLQVRLRMKHLGEAIKKKAGGGMDVEVTALQEELSSLVMLLKSSDDVKTASSAMVK